MRKTSRIAFIGAGNLARSLIAGLLRHGHDPAAIAATARSADRRERLAAEFGIVAGADNRAAATGAEILVLSVKPQQLAGVCTELAELDLSTTLVISVAAGATTDGIAANLGQRPALVRAMPNTPSSIGLGATGLYASAETSAMQRSQAAAIFRAVGEAVWLADEALMDAVTAVAGSGPAYYFAFMEAMQTAAEALGLPPEAARLLVKQTALGATTLAMRSELDLSELRRQVVSPGGTTAAALAVFEARQMADIVHEALGAATARGRELAQTLNQGSSD